MASFDLRFAPPCHSVPQAVCGAPSPLWATSSRGARPASLGLAFDPSICSTANVGVNTHGVRTYMDQQWKRPFACIDSQLEFEALSSLAEQHWKRARLDGDIGPVLPQLLLAHRTQASFSPAAPLVACMNEATMTDMAVDDGISAEVSAKQELGSSAQTDASSARRLRDEAFRAEVQRRAREEYQRYRQQLVNCDSGLRVQPCTGF